MVHGSGKSCPGDLNETEASKEVSTIYERLGIQNQSTERRLHMFFLSFSFAEQARFNVLNTDHIFE